MLFICRTINKIIYLNIFYFKIMAYIYNHNLLNIVYSYGQIGNKDCVANF